MSTSSNRPDSTKATPAGENTATPAGVALRDTPATPPTFAELLALAAKGGKQAVAEALDVSPDEVVRILAQDSVSATLTASSVIPSERKWVEESQDSAELTPESLETENFRIDSTGWIEKTDPNGVRYKENPEGDVWELLDGDFKGEQHFTWDAAMRETAKAGKRIPNKEEWEQILKDHPEFIPSLSGTRYYSNGSWTSQGSYGYYWSSSPNSAYAYYANFTSGGGGIADNSDRALGFSARCLKN